MARGFLSGVILGGIVSVGAAGVVSVILPPPSPPEVTDAAPGVAAPEQAAARQAATAMLRLQRRPRPRKRPHPIPTR